MNNVIVYSINGTVSVFRPDAFALQQKKIDKIAQESLLPGSSYRITDESNIPPDKEFRAHWTDANPGDTVDVDLDDAKITQMVRIRVARNSKWSDFDSRYIAAERDSDDLTDLNTERQMLKDIPNNAQSNVDAAITVDELKNSWPSELN